MLPVASPARRAGLALALLLAAVTSLHAADPAPEKVRLRLKWLHQFQFAGFYVALERGYYREEGLEVEILEGRPDLSYTDEVVSGRAEYGINNTDLLIDRVGGEPVVVLAAIFQHSPLILLSLRDTGVSSPDDLVGKRVMVSADAEAEIYSMISNEGIARGSVGLVPHSWDLEDLVRGRVDAVSAYSTNEPLLLSARGLHWTAVRPLTYGIDFYGDCLFTSEAELRGHPGRAAAFLRASVRGWHDAMDDPEAAARLIRSRWSTRKSLEELLREAQAMRDLILPDLVPLGFMNPGRWTHIGDTYAKLGAIPTDWSLEGFLHDPSPRRPDPRVLAAAGLAFLILAAAALAYILGLKAFNRRLAAEVASRTESLERLNRRLEAEIGEGIRRERTIAASLAEKEVLLKEVHHRVKNNLQVISSIVSLQLGQTGSESMASLLREIRTRVFGMALVHEQLYESGNLAGIDMDSYFRVLAGEIVSSFGREGAEVAVLVEAAGMALEVDEAIPVGLIVGELLTNSMKHAFPGRDRGMVAIRFSASPEGRLLTVSDDGVGCDPSCDGSGSLGLELVAALAAQLRGKVREVEGPGRIVELALPPAKPKLRAG